MPTYLTLIFSDAECSPCGPTAFWTFRDDIDSEVTLVVSRYADVSLRDEVGRTLLHKAVLRAQKQVSALLGVCLFHKPFYGDLVATILYASYGEMIICLSPPWFSADSIFVIM